MTRRPKEKKGPASPNTIDVQPKTKKKSDRPAAALRASDFGDSSFARQIETETPIETPAKQTETTSRQSAGPGRAATYLQTPLPTPPGPRQAERQSRSGGAAIHSPQASGDQS